VIWQRGQAPKLVAEIGLNHNGSVQLAKNTIDAAIGAGADFVKFQHCPPEQFDSSGTHNGESLFDLFKRTEFTFNQWIEIKEHCELVGIPFFVTTVSVEGVNDMHQLGVCAFKVSSDMINNAEMIQAMRKYPLMPVIVSTGHVRNLSDLLKIAWPEDLILHCISEYPTKHTKFWRMRAIQNMGYTCGYSNHIPGKDGIEACIRATELGAVIIETHFTTSKELSGPDHFFSFDPTDLKNLAEAIK